MDGLWGSDPSDLELGWLGAGWRKIECVGLGWLGAELRWIGIGREGWVVGAPWCC